MNHASGFRRLFRLFSRDPRRTAGAIDDELRFHLETRIDELVANGTAEPEARAIALGEFGDWSRYRDDCLVIDTHFARETRMRELIESVWADIRLAARTLRTQPGFAIVAVLTLSLGIGATTSVFSAVSGVLLRPLPYVNAERIVHLGEQKISRPGRGGTTSNPNYDDWRRSARSFATMGIVTNFSATLTGRGDPERVGAALVSAEMFDVFHVRPYIGRAIVAADNLPGADGVTLLSYDYWRARFGGDSSIVGQYLMLNLTPVLVIGVLPPGFAGPDRLDRPMWGNIANDTTDGRAGRSKEVYALLKPGVTVARAQAEMTQLAAQLATTYPQDDKGNTVIVDPLGDRTVGDLRRPLYLLLGASFLVLLIACANLSNLLLSRGLGRRREIAVRAALGAGRGRLIRQLLTESLVIAAAGSVIGIGIAAGTVKVLAALGPAVFAQRPPELNVGVLLASVGLSAFAALLFGLVPALRSSPRNPQLALREGAVRTVGGGTRRTRTALAIAQLSLAVMLLSASALVIKSFVRVLRVQPGIRGDHLLTMSVTLPQARYGGVNSTVFYEQLAGQLRGQPGIASVAFTSLIPFGGSYDRVNITQIRGQADRAGADAATADRYVVSASYFATMGVRLVAGRLPNDNDRFDAPAVCVVDEVFARHTFGDNNPIGQVITIPPQREATVVGVVTHVKTYGLDVESPGQIYLSNAQFPWRWSFVVVRTTGDPLSVAPSVARAVRSLDAAQPVSNIATMDAMMSALLRARRFTLALFTAFAGVAITLATIGLYGVIAYGVSQRRREFGIRMALGARPPEIARMVMLDGGRIAAAGLVIGAAGALAMGRFIASLLFELSARDATSFAAVAVGLVAVVVLACIVPARRATALDAAEVLRGD